MYVSSKVCVKALGYPSKDNFSLVASLFGVGVALNDLLVSISLQRRVNSSRTLG